MVAACSSSGGGAGSAAPSSAAPSAAASSAGPSSAAPSGSAASEGYEIKTAKGAPGTFLTGEDGMTLYIFKKDTQGNGKSVCNGDCASKWPPFTLDGDEQATAGSGVTGSKISTITRDDGSKQVAYDGWPLYYYQADTAAGQTNGQGVGNVWFVATP
jgi:predicted lipoprotein with Yx(FWY)xxD motif